MEDIAGKIQSLLSDEESLEQIKELAAMLSAESGAAENTDEGGGESGGFPVFALMQAMSAAGADDKDCALLLALRPHLSSEKQERIDRAVKLLKLYNIFTALRESGALGELEKML